jgi:hypothetical protein
MYKIYFSLAILFSSCLPRINYLGNSYTPTRDPDFFVDERSIEKPYKIIGKGYPDRVGSLFFETIQKKAIDKAKSKGADAVLIQDYFVQNYFTNIHPIHQSDTLGRQSIITGTSTIGTVQSDCPQFIILFLKYTDR